MNLFKKWWFWYIIIYVLFALFEDNLWPYSIFNLFLLGIGVPIFFVICFAINAIKNRRLGLNSARDWKYWLWLVLCLLSLYIFIFGNLGIFAV